MTRKTIIILAISLAPLFSARAWASDAERHFADRVWPLLRSRCVSCHGADGSEGNLRLDSRAAMLQGGASGPAIVPGRPRQSLLLEAVLHVKQKPVMPPKEQLSPAEIAVLDRWIRDGAPWAPPTPAEPATAPDEPAERIGDAWRDPRNPIVRRFGGQRLDLWSLRPVQRPDLPQVAAPSWVRNPIDRFVLRRGEVKGSMPAPEADRRTLARRLYFDLIGLPPSPEQTHQFLADERPDAYERLVDELLASPRHGEHAARMWLDVVRYSDSNGFDWDEYRPDAWRYRDYVIRSLNADKPYDRFVIEQLAGDELVAGAPNTSDERDALIATGYLRMGPQDNSAEAFGEQARARADLLADLVETTGSAMLGLTFSCCRCHDHKHDPLAQADYYRFRAFFEAVTYSGDAPLDLPTDRASIERQNAAIEARLQPLRQRRETLVKTARTRLRSDRRTQLRPAERKLLALDEAQVGEESKGLYAELQARFELSDEDVLAELTKQESRRLAEIDGAMENWQRQRRPFEQGLMMTDATGDVAATHVLYQGDYRSPREQVRPGFLLALEPNAAEIPRGTNPRTTGRRLALARWIVAAENPWTARVIVNRLWQTYFGRGIVATPNDFGLAGEPPTDPELLDWLAAEFMSEGWSLKKLRRRMVTSATYRQAAASETRESSAPLGPHVRRLSAEQLRDALLAVAGLLDSRSAGPPVWPELPAEILQANPAFLDDNESKTKGWYPSPAAEQHCRSAFLVQKRTVRVPFLETFDLPENIASCACRRTSTTASQALSLLNSSLAAAAAQEFAARVQREASKHNVDQVDRAFQLALQRLPSDDERARCRRFLAEGSLAELCRVLLNLNEFQYVE